MLFQASLRLLLLLTLPLLPCNGADASVPKKSSNNTSDDPRLLLVVSLSGLNADDLDRFSMPNLMHLRSHASHPTFFLPQYPGTAAPNLYSMATGLYPENHGVLADKVYDPKQDKILTEKDPGYFTQNPTAIPIWTLNEYHHGVSACLMWPGCEVTLAGHKPTYHVPYNDSYSFTDLVDLVVSFASAKFTKEDYMNFVAGRASEPATVEKTAMVKNNTVEKMEKLKYRGNKTEDVEWMEAVEHGKEKTRDEDMMKDVEHGGNKTGDEEMTKAGEHGDQKSGEEDMTQVRENVGNKTGDTEINEAAHHGIRRMDDVDKMDNVKRDGEKMRYVEVTKAVKNGGKKTGDEEEVVQGMGHSNNKIRGHKEVIAVMEHSSNETNGDKEMIPGMKHRNNETGEEEVVLGMEHSNNETSSHAKMIQGMDQGDNESVSVKEVIPGKEHSNNKTGGDEEMVQGMEHSNNDTAKRSPSDLRRLHKRDKRSYSWTHHYMAPDWKHRYSSETEDKYKVVSITTEDTDNKIKHIIDAHDQTIEKDTNRFLYETFEEAANLSTASKQNFTWHPYPFFKNLARTKVVYTLEPKARADLVMVRFDEPARTARRYGPHSPQMMAALHTLDTGLLYLHLQLQRYHLQHNTDIILVSDHASTVLGFNPSNKHPSMHRAFDNPWDEPSKDDSEYQKFFIDIDSILDPSLCTVSGETPLLHIWPKSGKRDQVFGLLSNASAKNHFSVYESQHFSYDAYHTSDNPRISKILLEADPGYAFSDKIADRALAGPWERNGSKGMPLMLAAGPSFRENFEGFSMEAVDLYPLMMEVLNIHDGPPINGSFMLPSFMLKTIPIIIYNASWVFAVMAVIILILLVVLISCCFHHVKRHPVSPVPQPQRMSTIYRSTVEPDSSFVEYDVRVIQSPRGNRSRSAPGDSVDGGRTALTPARLGKVKKALAPAIPFKVGEEGEGDEHDERSQLLQKKANSTNVK